jgi:LysR family glycine cleavage system transcriptional activator
MHVRIMAGSKTTLPPFAALRAFHAAATHDRYKDAAESLGLTESAISHQVKRLEDFLRTPLIDRSGSRPVLTDTGRRYLEQIEPALRQIRAATEALMPAEGRATVRMTLPPSLAAAWLIPRLGAFEREHPEINLQLITTTRVIDLRRDQMDFAIRHGKGAWPDVEAVFLLAEAAMPVCAPGYVEALPGGDANGLPADLLGERRLIVNANFPEFSHHHGRDGTGPPARRIGAWPGDGATARGRQLARKRPAGDAVRRRGSNRGRLLSLPACGYPAERRRPPLRALAGRAGEGLARRRAALRT